MRQIAQRVFRYTTLVVMTLTATALMWWASIRTENDGTAGRPEVAPVAAVAQPKPTVAVTTLSVEMCELSATFTGKIRPWEVFSLGFEVPGRVVELGQNQAGRPLDDGDPVASGQLLAQLDDRVFKAQKSEAVARLEQATTDMNRARAIRERNPGAISETEFQAQLTQLALARAQQEMALKNLDDTTLVAPVDSTIARRYVNVGESVQAHQMAFELLEDSTMLLVVDVPESEVYDLESRLRVVGALGKDFSSHSGDAEDRVFRAYVTLEGRDRFGRQRPEIPAEVHLIAQMADTRTGLFEVEIRVPNEDRSLRAGMVARARIVVDRVRGYQIPEAAVLFRGDEAYVFAVGQREVPLSVMFWDAADSLVHEVHRVKLERWIEQGDLIFVPEQEYAFEQIVVRGQQRLADGQVVRVVAPNSKAPPPLPESTAQIRASTPANESN
jgi:RND family efflux transporter MFP subunit